LSTFFSDTVLKDTGYCVRPDNGEGIDLPIGHEEEKEETGSVEAIKA
jgi:hypothetical protein